jgi:hypothetical protein
VVDVATCGQQRLQSRPQRTGTEPHRTVPRFSRSRFSDHRRTLGASDQQTIEAYMFVTWILLVGSGLISTSTAPLPQTLEATVY